MRHSICLLLLAGLSTTATLTHAVEQKNAEHFITFKALPDDDSSSDCTQRGGQRVTVFNDHPSSAIDISLDRYFSDVRQPGRSMFALHSGHSQALGCNIVMDSPQRWELIDATFISVDAAKKRYGSIF